MGALLMKKNYLEELQKSMLYIYKNKKNSIFLGQSLNYSGNSIFNTLIDIPRNKKIETPVFEELQMGISIGLAIEGYLPITCYPRFDFLVSASNQLINHLDKIEYLTMRKDIKVIIRTSVGSKKPLDGGPQHTQDHTEVYKKALKNIKVIKLNKTGDIFNTYKKILNDKFSYLVVELGDKYNQ